MRTSSLILILSASGSACSSASRIAVLVLLLVCTEPRVRLLVSIPAIELLGDGYGQGAVARLKMLIQPARGS